jgi:hypothetical protein
MGRCCAEVITRLSGTQVVARAASPRTHQFAFQLVRLERGLKSIFGQSFQSRLEAWSRLRIPFQQAPGRAHEAGGLQKNTPHFMISRIN